MIWDVLAPIVAVAATGWVAGAAFEGGWQTSSTSPIGGPALLLAAIAPFAIGAVGGYERPTGRCEGGLGLRLLGVATVSAWCVWLVAAAIGWTLDLTQLAAVWLLLPFLWLGSRLAARVHARRHPERVLIVGGGEIARQVATLIARSGGSLEVLGRLDEGPDAPAPDPLDAPILGPPEALRSCVELLDIDRVIVSFSWRRDEELLDVLRDCDDLPVAVDVVPRMFDLVGFDPHTRTLRGLPLMTVRPRHREWGRPIVKRAVDVVVAAALLVATAPLMLAIALAIKVDDRGPVFFRQRRVGRAGAPFSIVKFRTMRRDGELHVPHASPSGCDEAVPAHLVVSRVKHENRARLTRIGGLLRTSSLDELPQLWNVLVGHMSLVGPRPLRPFEVAALRGWQRVRQEMRPGITGLWQVLGRSEVEWDERMQLDYSYVRHWSLRNDARIMSRTLPAVLGRRGAL